VFIPLTAAPSADLRPETSLISPNDWAVLADHWYPVAIASALAPQQVLKATLLDVELVLFRGADGQASAVLDMCPHRGVRLSIGEVVDGQIVCPFHGLRFDATGRCTHVPALGATSRLPPSYQVRRFPVREHVGLLWTCVGDAEKHGLPRYPKLEDAPPGEVGILEVLDWPVSAARQIENFFDLAHLPFVHANTLGGNPDAPLKPGRIEQSDDAVTLHARYIETSHGEKPCLYTYRVVLPFSIEFQVQGEDDPDYLLRSADIASPVSARSCRVFQLLRYGADAAARDGLAAGLGVVNGEDIHVLSAMRQPDLPLDQRHEIHLPVDNISHAYRARLKGMGLGR
jgi:vanillate O-demethylase monooxygenase subunit